MGFEIFVMAFVLSSFAFGIVFPVVGWATWVDVNERRILTMLRARLLRAAPAPEARDGTLAAVFVDVGDRHIEISARERGRTALWRLVVPCSRRAALGRFIVVEKDWTSALREHGAMTFRDVEGLSGYRMAVADVVDERSLAERPLAHPCDDVLVRALHPVMHGLHLLELRVEHENITFDVVRDGLVPDDVWALLLRCLHVVSVLDRHGPPPLLPTTGSLYVDGSPRLLPPA